jgi:hypothetical protein
MGPLWKRKSALAQTESNLMCQFPTCYTIVGGKEETKKIMCGFARAHAYSAVPWGKRQLCGVKGGIQAAKKI